MSDYDLDQSCVYAMLWQREGTTRSSVDVSCKGPTGRKERQKEMEKKGEAENGTGISWGLI